MWNNQESIELFNRPLRLPVASTSTEFSVDPRRSNLVSILSSYRTVQELLITVVHQLKLDIHPIHAQRFDDYLATRTLGTKVTDFVDICFWWCIFEALGIATPVRRMFVEMDVLYAVAAQFWSVHIVHILPLRPIFGKGDTIAS